MSEENQPMRYLKSCLPILLIALAGCATLLGTSEPKTFSERLGAGYVTAATVRSVSTILLDADEITSADARNVQQQADTARAGLDIAKTLPDGEAKLQSALAVLQAAMSYLCAKSPEHPNCLELTSARPAP